MQGGIIVKLRYDAQIVERAEKKVYLVLGDKEICLSDEPGLEEAVNKLYFGSVEVDEAILERLKEFVE